jgi:hypothetical protein
MVTRVALDPGPAGDAALAAVDAALAKDPSLEVVLVGPYERGAEDGRERLTVRAAWGRSQPDVDPAVAVRGQADLPVRVAIAALADGDVDVVVSAASPDVLLTAARFALPRRRGVRDPMLATRVAVGPGDCWILDSSARPGTVALALADAATELRGDRAGVLIAGERPVAAERDRLEAARSRGIDATPVVASTWVDAGVDVLLVDGALGAVLVGTLAGVGRPAGPGRVLGLEQAAVWHARPVGLVDALLMAATEGTS